MRGSPLLRLPLAFLAALARAAAFLPPIMPGMPGMPGMPPFITIFIWRWASKKLVTSVDTSPTATPEPLAMRDRREPLMILGFWRSAGVMERTIASARSRSFSLTWSSISLFFAAPGIMPRMFFSGPSLRSMPSCSMKSSRVSPSPPISRFATLAACSASNAFSACSMSVRTSPMSRMRSAIRSGWKMSKSASFSPVDANITGLPVSAAIDSAAPPRASPSSLVSTTPS